MKNKRMWEFKNIAENKESADLYIYSEIEEDSWWSDSETSANAFKAKIDEISDVKNLNIYINSYGGSVKEGLAINSILQRFNGFKTVYVDGMACSIATVIAMAADKVCVYPHSIMMIHNALCSCCGNADELRKVADDLDKVTDSIKSAYLSKRGINIDKDKLTELMNAETCLTASECLEYGFADEIVDIRTANNSASKSMNKAYFDRMQKMFNCYAGNINSESDIKNDIKNETSESEIVENTPPAAVNNYEKTIKIFENFMGGYKNV